MHPSVSKLNDIATTARIEVLQQRVADSRFKHEVNFLYAFAGEKTNKLSPRRKARKGVWGKNKSNIEVLCGLCAFAREKKQI
jgi:hypothetical protein